MACWNRHVMEKRMVFFIFKLDEYWSCCGVVYQVKRGMTQLTLSLISHCMGRLRAVVNNWEGIIGVEIQGNWLS